MGRLERGESGVTVEALATILAALGVSLGEFFSSFTKVVRPGTAVGADQPNHLLSSKNVSARRVYTLAGHGPEGETPDLIGWIRCPLA